MMIPATREEVGEAVLEIGIEVAIFGGESQCRELAIVEEELGVSKVVAVAEAVAHMEWCSPRRNWRRFAAAGLPKEEEHRLPFDYTMTV